MGSIDELIKQAREIIGKADRDDFIIQPTAHYGKYADSAPALAEILKVTKVTSIAEEYERQDSIAIQAQTHFKKITFRANIAILLTALFGVLILITNSLDNIDDAKQNILRVLGAAGAVAGGLAAMWLYLIDKGRSLQKWMSRRADAETQRLAYFEAVTGESNPEHTDSELPPALLQLEYFLRYQLEVQIIYYDRSAVRHEATASRTLRIGSAAVLIGCIATGLAGFVNAFWAALGVLGAAMSSFASSWEAMNQDRRNAERYERTRKALQALKAEIDGVRKAAAGGNREPMEKFVAAVHEQLSLEHRQWLETEEYIGQALLSLRESMAKQKFDS
jgi:hypothetical protein